VAVSDKDILNWIQNNVTNIEVRDYQIEAWLKLQERRSLGRRRALIHLATGLGKTSVAAVDALHYLKEENKTGRVLFVSHMNDISHQAKNTFLFVNPGFTTAIFRGKLKDAEITFSTFQALHGKLDEIDPNYFSYIIWDEAHHIEAETFSQVREHFTPEFELGLTATPERADGRDILNYFGHPIFTKSLSDGINDGWLSSVDYHIVFDEAIKKAMNEKFEISSLKDIRELFAIRSRNEIISKEVLDRRHEIGLDRAKTIVFCQNIDAATQMAELLGGEVYHSRVSADERQALMLRFKSGHLQVICTVDMFNEGIDIPDARLIVFLRSTSSRTIFEQQLGRGLRRAPDKSQVTVLDFVANVERINFVRELGRHVAASSGGSRGFYSSGALVDEGQVPEATNVFSFNSFEFEDQVIELMERYETLSGIEYLKTSEVVAEYNKYKSIQRVADKFGVTWQAVKKHLKKAGIDTSERIERARSIPVEEVAAKYAELGSINKVSAHFDVSTHIVKSKLLQSGTDITSRAEPVFASPELIEAVKRTGSIRQAAIELGIGRHAARNRLIRSGIDTSRKVIRKPVTKKNKPRAKKQASI